MKLGTADLIASADEIVGKPVLTLGGGSSSSGNGPSNRGGGGGDGPRPSSDDLAENETPDPTNKFRILTWFLLLIVLMTFGGLIGAYVVIATNNVAEWAPFTLPIQVWVSTALILASSGTYYIAEKAIKANIQERGKRFLLATTVLGGVFIASQLLAWVALSNRGLYMQGNPYVGFFYLLTAVHAVHVLGGITALSAILLRSWYPTSNEVAIRRRIGLAQVVGWYWHFMGLLWIVLFVLLGFWK
ncbi:MAG: cytochrome c oxidase subunit 3 [Chloracidobacterium sp.]|nr:cytochrome c oxidase subunit 3 [Chloracidobacterium sp.]